jgi:3-deoxy-7-phosphoheptulonate synthase
MGEPEARAMYLETDAAPPCEHETDAAPPCERETEAVLLCERDADGALCERDVLPSPRALREAVPLAGAATLRTLRTRRAIRDVLRGSDRRRLLLVVGPCSIHDPGAALEYAHRLSRLAAAVGEALVVVMRTYFEKPRTTLGWKGLLNDPHLDGTGDLATGLHAARRLLAEIGELGLACGSELLDPLAARYLEDGLAWACIGARTAESQPHRELASGLEVPVGFKNAVSGDLRVAVDAVVAARGRQSCFGLDDEGRPVRFRTRGNADAHIVLRGGSGVRNCDAETVGWAAARVRGDASARPVLVDCSHGNSNKDHRLQARACREVLEQLRRGQNGIAGLMLESHLREGRQDWRPGARLRPGVSITDACIGWEETEDLVGEIAETVRSRD